ncbi:MAG: hypothetical protein F6K40_29920 [Okeania sp. SIO3I5]|uniref:hypothetical protein n=1 Tax=Okeania sp. SIO3I5 TaxID=2607805 RepID=UPI0013BBEDCC|nr:hypothetical protein [Okeania sp. SIO3I5]NEQ40236.1 hypothetical protein [Okeania sp. SIO3I5]
MVVSKGSVGSVGSVGRVGRVGRCSKVGGIIVLVSFWEVSATRPKFALCQFYRAVSFRYLQ